MLPITGDSCIDFLRSLLTHVRRCRAVSESSSPHNLPEPSSHKLLSHHISADVAIGELTEIQFFSESIDPDLRPTPTDVYYNTSVFYFRTSHCFATQQVSTNYCSTIVKYMHYLYTFLLQLHHHCIWSSSLHLSFDNTTFFIVSIQQILYLTFGSSETGIWEEQRPSNEFLWNDRWWWWGWG